MKEPTPAYSPDTDTHYTSWEGLVEAESNGWVAVAINTRGTQQWPWVVGPFPTKREASNARIRMRTKWKREQEQYPGQSVRFYVRPAWNLHTFQSASFQKPHESETP